jgi:hypothetical protein
MPAEIPEITELKASGDLETQAAVRIDFKDGSKAFIASKEMILPFDDGGDDVTFIIGLRKRPTIQQSIRTIIDQISFEIQNADKIMGQTIFSSRYVLNGSNAILWRVYIAPDGTRYFKERARGVIAAAKAVAATHITCVMIPDTNYRAKGNGSRTMMESCMLKFKLDPRCGSVDPSETCNHDVAACMTKLPSPVIINPVPPDGQGNLASFGGLIGIQINSSSTSTSTGGGTTSSPSGGGGALTPLRPIIDGNGGDDDPFGYRRYGPRTSPFLLP